MIKVLEYNVDVVYKVLLFSINLFVVLIDIVSFVFDVLFMNFLWSLLG